MFIARLYLARAIASPSDRPNEPATTDTAASGQHRPRYGQLPIPCVSISRPIYERAYTVPVFVARPSRTSTVSATDTHRRTLPRGSVQFRLLGPLRHPVSPDSFPNRAIRANTTVVGKFYGISSTIVPYEFHGKFNTGDTITVFSSIDPTDREVRQSKRREVLRCRVRASSVTIERKTFQK